MYLLRNNNMYLYFSETKDFIHVYTTAYTFPFQSYNR